MSRSFHWYRSRSVLAQPAPVLMETNVPAAATPLDWDAVPGNTPEEKRESLEKEFSLMLGQSPNPIADAYSAVQKIPYKPQASPEFILPAHERFQQLRTLTDDKTKKNAQEALDIFGGNIQNVIGKVLYDADTTLIPEIASLFGERVGVKMKEKFLGLGDARHTDMRKAVRAYRNQQVRGMQSAVFDLAEKCMLDYHMTSAEFTHFAQGRDAQKIGAGYTADDSDDSDDTDLVQRLGGAEKAAKLKNQIEGQLAGKISNIENGGTSLGTLWSGKKDAPGREFYGAPEPITAKEVLDSLGFSYANFPRKPSDELQVVSHKWRGIDRKDMTPEQLEETNATYAQNRDDPHNLAILRRYIEEGGHDIDSDLANVIGKNPSLSGDNRHSSRLIYYIWATLCEKNPRLFREMLEKAGRGDLKDNLNRNLIPDQTFAEFGLDFRSKAEEKCVGKLRDSFGLMATPYPLSIPAPKGCPTNSDRFTIDFTIPCAVLETWEADEQGDFHPQVSETVVFVGEYFGYDATRATQVPQDQDWIDIDGNVAKTTGKDGQEKEMLAGTLITDGQKYHLRSNWKRMTETFVADTAGYKAIHLDKDLRDKPIMAELDRNEIVYQSRACPAGDPSCAVAMHQLISHAKTCQMRDCDSHKFTRINPDTGERTLNPQSYSPAEAYVLSCIADMKMRMGLMPVLNTAYAEGFGREEMYAYYNAMQGFYNGRVALKKEYQNALASGDQALAQKLSQDYSRYQIGADFLRDTHLGSLVEKYESFTETDVTYKRLLNGLQQVLQAVRDGQLSGGAVRDACRQFITPDNGQAGNKQRRASRWWPRP